MTNQTNFTRGGLTDLPLMTGKGALARVKAPILRFLADRRAKKSRDEHLAALNAKLDKARKSHGPTKRIQERMRKLTHEALRTPQ